MIVDPWGLVLAQCSDGEGVCLADLDLARQDEVRRTLPSLTHRRPDVYAADVRIGDAGTTGEAG